MRTIGAFGIFCAAASAVYLFNDCLDAEADRMHSVKRHRPIASGALSVPLALGASVVLAGGALASAWFLARWQLTVVVLAYLAISVAYSLRLKREPVIELAAVASGFVFRAIAGGAATHVPLSSWFLVVACFGSLFIVTGKRLAERRKMGEGEPSHRVVLGQYTTSFLESTLTLAAAVTVTGYCLWAFDRTGLISRPNTHVVWIELTVVPIVLGVLVILLRIDSGHGEAPEELMMHDRTLQILGLLWVALFAIGLYG